MPIPCEWPSNLGLELVPLFSLSPTSSACWRDSWLGPLSPNALAAVSTITKVIELGEDAFDRGDGSQVLPLFGWKGVKREQLFSSLARHSQAFGYLAP